MIAVVVEVEDVIEVEIVEDASVEASSLPSSQPAIKKDIKSAAHVTRTISGRELKDMFRNLSKIFAPLARTPFTMPALSYLN